MKKTLATLLAVGALAGAGMSATAAVSAAGNNSGQESVVAVGWWPDTKPNVGWWPDTSTQGSLSAVGWWPDTVKPNVGWWPDAAPSV